jgi:hypothetical protein
MTMQKMKPQALLLLAVFALGGGSYASGVSRYSCRPDDSWARCVKEQPFEIHQFGYWIQKGSHFSVRYAPKSGTSCANPGFPVLEVTDSRVDNWVQILHLHRAAPDTKQGPGFNISGSASEWIMVDTSPKARELGRPFAKESQHDTYFYDHPCWAYGANEHLDWEAFLFPVKVKDRTITPIGGVRWGYDYSPERGRITPKPLSEIKPGAWNSFRSKLQAAYPNWKFL